MSQFEQGAGRIEAADPERRCASSVDADLAASILDAGDVIQWNREPLGSIAGEERVESGELELADVSRPIAFVPPDGVAASAHGRRIGLAAPTRISGPSQRPCGKTAGSLGRSTDGSGPARSHTEPKVQKEESC